VLALVRPAQHQAMLVRWALAQQVWLRNPLGVLVLVELQVVELQVVAAVALPALPALV
jgi:hypothetical protein